MGGVNILNSETVFSAGTRRTSTRGRAARVLRECHTSEVRGQIVDVLCCWLHGQPNRRWRRLLRGTPRPDASSQKHRSRRAALACFPFLTRALDFIRFPSCFPAPQPSTFACEARDPGEHVGTTERSKTGPQLEEDRTCLFVLAHVDTNMQAHRWSRAQGHGTLVHDTQRYKHCSLFWRARTRTRFFLCCFYDIM